VNHEPAHPAALDLPPETPSVIDVQERREPPGSGSDIRATDDHSGRHSQHRVEKAKPP